MSETDPAPAPRRQDRDAAASPGPPVEEVAGPALVDVVGAGLAALRDLRAPGKEIGSGALESTLRVAAAQLERRCAALPDTGPLGGVAARLRVACAHLAAQDLVEARLALGAVHEALNGRPDDPLTARARSVSGAHKRELRRKATVEQAVGVLAAHSGRSPREALALLRAHAARRGVAVLELADDVVAGRVDAGVLGST